MLRGSQKKKKKERMKLCSGSCVSKPPRLQESRPESRLSTRVSSQIFKIQSLGALSGEPWGGSHSPGPSSIWHLLHGEPLSPTAQLLDGWGSHKTVRLFWLRDSSVLCAVLLRASASALSHTPVCCCHLSKQRVLWPSSQQPLQLPPAVHPEGIQDGEKQGARPR